jgi:hypothetical protein
MLPNFLVIGSQKAGTTSIYHVLKAHPQVFLPERKEINYFFHEGEYAKGEDWYRSHFDALPEGILAWGEATPGYIVHPEAPFRIYQLLKDVKLILTVRNPIDRAYSQYWDNRRSLSEHRAFEKVVEIALEETYHPQRLGYFSRGTYFQYIQRYLALFPLEKLLVLTFEDLLQEPQTFYERIFSFLGVDPSFTTSLMIKSFNPASVWENPFYRWFFKKASRSRLLPAKMRRLTYWGRRTLWHYPPMQADLRQKLVEFYRPWNSKLGAFLGRELLVWDE